jgi:hypothetical protein
LRGLGDDSDGPRQKARERCKASVVKPLQEREKLEQQRRQREVRRICISGRSFAQDPRGREQVHVNGGDDRARPRLALLLQGLLLWLDGSSVRGHSSSSSIRTAGEGQQRRCVGAAAEPEGVHALTTLANTLVVAVLLAAALVAVAGVRRGGSSAVGTRRDVQPRCTGGLRSHGELTEQIHRSGAACRLVRDPERAVTASAVSQSSQTTRRRAHSTRESDEAPRFVFRCWVSLNSGNSASRSGDALRVEKLEQDGSIGGGVNSPVQLPHACADAKAGSSLSTRDADETPGAAGGDAAAEHVAIKRAQASGRRSGARMRQRRQREGESTAADEPAHCLRTRTGGRVQ